MTHCVVTSCVCHGLIISWGMIILPIHCHCCHQVTIAGTSHNVHISHIHVSLTIQYTSYDTHLCDIHLSHDTLIRHTYHMTHVHHLTHPYNIWHKPIDYLTHIRQQTIPTHHDAYNVWCRVTVRRHYRWHRVCATWGLPRLWVPRVAEEVLHRLFLHPQFGCINRLGPRLSLQLGHWPLLWPQLIQLKNKGKFSYSTGPTVFITLRNKKTFLYRTIFNQIQPGLLWEEFSHAAITAQKHHKYPPLYAARCSFTQLSEQE